MLTPESVKAFSAFWHSFHFLTQARHPSPNIHEPLPELLALPPAALPLNLPSITSFLLPMATAADERDDAASGLTLCSSVVPMPFSQVLDPDHSVRCWLTYALPLVLAPWVAEAEVVPVRSATLSVVTEAAPVMNKTRQSAKATGKSPPKRSPKNNTAAAR